MKLSRIKHICTSLLGKQKRGNGYLKSEIRLDDLPGHSNGRNTGQFRKRKGRILLILRLLTGRKRGHYTGYTKSVSSKKNLFRTAAVSLLSISLLLFILLGGVRKIEYSLESLPLFLVSGIEFSGNETIPADTLREATGIILHQTSLISLDCSRVEQSLTAIPWVGRATVKRNWPATVEISIVENVPVALLLSKGSQGSQLHYMDKKGKSFLRVRQAEEADIDYPIITGLPEITDQAVRAKALREVLVFLEDVNGNNPHLPAQSVSEIHVNPKGELVVYLVEYPFPIFFGKGNTGKKYYRLVQVLKTLYKKQKGKGSISQVEYIQMDYLDDKVLVARSESG